MTALSYSVSHHRDFVQRHALPEGYLGTPRCKGTKIIELAFSFGRCGSEGRSQSIGSEPKINFVEPQLSADLAQDSELTQVD